MIYKKEIINSFNKYSKIYNNYSFFQKLINKFLINKIILKSRLLILDAGCGTGYFIKEIKKFNNIITVVDFSLGMLFESKINNSSNYYIYSDLSNLLILNNIFDITISNLVIQWTEYKKVIKEFYRITNNKGKIIFSTLIEGSLIEFNKSKKIFNLFNKINKFPRFEKIDKICNKRNINIDIIKIKFFYKNFFDLLNSLKKIGSFSLNKNNFKRKLSKSNINLLFNIWPKNNKGYYITYKILSTIIE